LGASRLTQCPGESAAVLSARKESRRRFGDGWEKAGRSSGWAKRKIHAGEEHKLSKPWDPVPCGAGGRVKRTGMDEERSEYHSKEGSSWHSFDSGRRSEPSKKCVARTWK